MSTENGRIRHVHSIEITDRDGFFYAALSVTVLVRPRKMKPDAVIPEVGEKEKIQIIDVRGKGVTEEAAHLEALANAERQAKVLAARDARQRSSHQFT